MGVIIRLVEVLLLLVPVGLAVFYAVRSLNLGGRRGEPELEPADEVPAPRPPAQTRGDQPLQWRTITRTVEEHARTDARWLEYELDAAKLLDYPLMTDVGDERVMRFHRAKLRADVLRPDRAEDLLDDRDSADAYLTAVEDYVTAFNAAESEAMRLRRSDFSQDAQQRLARAQSLLRVAQDSSATVRERAQSLDLADRELDGLLVLPSSTRSGIERGIAGEIGPGHPA